MKKTTLFDRCKVTTNIENDMFVGIHKIDGCYNVMFPLGFHLSEDEKGLRKDILLLMDVLAHNAKRKESEIHVGGKRNDIPETPIKAYLFFIKDFFKRGYYRERETLFQTAKRGNISWRRTIKTQKSIIQDGEVYYLDFIVKKKAIKENELITLIHKYCVYESFDKFGWIFTGFVPTKPQISLTKKGMISIVRAKIQNTFNDSNRLLFSNMLLLLNYLNGEENKEFEYGTHRFEYVWEKMIDHVFGFADKAEYFPKTTWDLKDNRTYNNAYLEPDSIMIYGGKIYVLDAKYYKFGSTGRPAHLPESTSINKQITYGEYIAESEKFVKDGKNPIVYNAFIMPYDSQGTRFPTNDPIYCIGTATSDWKKGHKEYERIIGVLMDIKYLMTLETESRNMEIMRLAQLIEENIKKSYQ